MRRDRIAENGDPLAEEGINRPFKPILRPDNFGRRRTDGGADFHCFPCFGVSRDRLTSTDARGS